jgi:hypothetical protein
VKKRDRKEIKRLMRTEDAATTGEFIVTNRELGKDPDLARGMFDVLRVLAETDQSAAGLLLDALEGQSIVTAQERILVDDQFALRVGRRVGDLMLTYAPSHYIRRTS